MRDGHVVGLMTIVHNGDPDGYKLRVHLVDSHGPDDPRNLELMQKQLRWTLEGARGCLAQSRLIIQALESTSAPFELRRICKRLTEVLANRFHEKRRGYRRALVRTTARHQRQRQSGPTTRADVACSVTISYGRLVAHLDPGAALVDLVRHWLSSLSPL